MIRMRSARGGLLLPLAELQMRVADARKFTSRILEGWRVFGGFTERWRGRLFSTRCVVLKIKEAGGATPGSFA